MSNTIEGMFDDMCEMLEHNRNKLMNDIQDFHWKFKLPSSPQPRQLPLDMASFRIAFMEEELAEYIQAYNDCDLEGQFDALIDLVYVVLGTAHMQGLPFNEGWDRVHEANMKKMRAADASDSKRRSTYDVIKPEGWVAPDLSDLILENK